MLGARRRRTLEARQLRRSRAILVSGMSILWAIYAFFLSPILTMLFWVVIIGAVLSWLFAFNVVNRSNEFVVTIYRITQAITEPLLRPFRAFIPPLGGVDITPILLLLTIQFVNLWLLPTAIRAVVGLPGA